MTHPDDELAEILVQRALTLFTRSGLGQLFVPDEGMPATLKANADLKDILLDAFRTGQQRAGGYATPIDEDLAEAHEHATAAANSGA